MGGAGSAGKDPGYPKHRVGSSHLGDGGKIRGQRGLSQVSFESFSITREIPGVALVNILNR